MEDLKLYGHYYKRFKRNGGIPCKVTIIDIDDDTVTIIRGHYAEEELKDCSGLVKMRCNKDSIIRKISKGMKKQVNQKDKEFDDMLEKADRALEKFKNGY